MNTTTNVTPIKSGKAEDVVPVACAFIIAMGATFFTPSEPANGNGTDTSNGGIVSSPSNTEWKENMYVQSGSTPQHRVGDIDDVGLSDRYLGLRQHYCKESLAGAYNKHQPSLGIHMASVMLERNSSSISCFV